MNYRKLSDNDLADFAENVLTLLGGTQLSAINTAVRAALSTEIGTLPTDLNGKALEAMTAEGARKAIVSEKNTMHDTIVDLMSQVRTALVAGRAPKEQFDVCNFDFRDEINTLYQAQDPMELSVFGYSNGVNKGKFKGNNTYGRVKYEIWRRVGDTGPWTLLTMVTKQSFRDTPVLPGQRYEYKVRAVGTKTVSDFSNSTYVYGV